MIQPITDTREGENKELIHFCFYFLDIIKYTPHLTVLVLCGDDYDIIFLKPYLMNLVSIH